VPAVREVPEAPAVRVAFLARWQTEGPGEQAVRAARVALPSLSATAMTTLALATFA